MGMMFIENGALSLIVLAMAFNPAGVDCVRAPTPVMVASPYYEFPVDDRVDTGICWHCRKNTKKWWDAGQGGSVRLWACEYQTKLNREFWGEHP